jgi:hypothetical protein
MREIFIMFHKFSKKKSTKPEIWFQLFKRTVADVFFNEKNWEEVNKISIFEETKQKGFTKNILAAVYSSIYCKTIETFTGIS